MPVYDAVVLGAGPAGLTAALELAGAGWKVLILDKETLPREKVCGGFLGPENKERLKRYGVLDRLLGTGARKVEHYGISASNGVSIRLPVMFEGRPDFGIGVSRKTLDGILQNQARSRGVAVLDSARVQSARSGRIQELTVLNMKSGDVSTIETRHVIHACGASQRAESGARLTGLGVSALFRNVRGLEDDVYLHFVDKGHVGINCFENGLVNVCYMADRGLVSSFKGDLERVYVNFLRRNPLAAQQLGDAERVTAWRGIAIPRGGKPVFVRDGQFCAGDSVAAVHPVVGGGMSLAMESAGLLAELMIRYEPAGLRFESVAQEYERCWRRRFAWQIGMSRLWGSLSHYAPLANGVIRLFRFNKNLLDRAFRLHHGLPGLKYSRP